MEAPKYILKLIDRRARLARDLMDADVALCDWLEKHGILEDLEPYDYHTGAEMYVNPFDSARRIVKAIERK